jgi:hypothetical protein
MQGDRQAGVVWGCLQAHRVMGEYVDADFAGHPRCSHILNLHLQDNALMKTECNAYTKKTDALIADLVKSVKNVEALANSALRTQKQGEQRNDASGRRGGC